MGRGKSFLPLPHFPAQLPLYPNVASEWSFFGTKKGVLMIICIAWGCGEDIVVRTHISWVEDSNGPAGFDSWSMNIMLAFTCIFIIRVH